MADSNKSRLLAKEKGLCVCCKKPRGRDGWYCNECLIKERERHRKDRIWYIQNGICPVCRKEKLFGTEKTCPECLVKSWISQQKIDKETKRERERSYYGRRKEIREEYKRNGICYDCRKREVEIGKSRCRICLEKNAAIKRKKYTPIREDRVNEGFCYQCLKEKATNGKLCKGCYEKANFRLENVRKKSNYYESHRKIIKAALM